MEEERRTSARIRFLKGATIVTIDRKSGFSRTVRNISNESALLDLPSRGCVPDRFELGPGWEARELRKLIVELIVWLHAFELTLREAF